MEQAEVSITLIVQSTDLTSEQEIGRIMSSKREGGRCISSRLSGIESVTKNFGGSNPLADHSIKSGSHRICSKFRLPFVNVEAVLCEQFRRGFKPVKQADGPT